MQILNLSQLGSPNAFLAMNGREYIFFLDK